MSAAPRFLMEGGGDDPTVVVRSATWGFNAIGFFDGDEAAVVDPGIAPAEIEALAEAVRTRGRRGAPRRVTHVLLTHSHHDHVRGWRRFPGASVSLPRAAAEKPAPARERILAAKRKLDERVGLAEPDFGYPEADLVFEERATVRVGGLELELRSLPGHSDCTSVVWVPALRTLCSADYLVSPGLPYCRWQARAFEQALATLRRWTVEEGVERVLPAHNTPIVGQAAVLEALEREARYFERLRAAVRAGLAEGLSAERTARRAAKAMGEWRGVDLGGRARQDLDNAQRVLAEEAPA